MRASRQASVRLGIPYQTGNRIGPRAEVGMALYAVVVPPRATAVPSETAESEPTQRDRHLQHIADHGRMAWQKASGYTKRARAEAAIGRWKQVIGDRLRAHTEERRATEVDVAVYVLNRMLDLGRPKYVRVA